MFEMKRNPKIEPMAGDEFAGPVAKVKILSVTHDETGLARVELVGSGLKFEYNMNYKTTFSADRFRKFVEPGEVIQMGRCPGDAGVGE